LERDGDIKCYKAILNSTNFGLTTLAFVRITLRDETDFRATLAQLNAHAEIQEIHTIGEGYDFLIKIRVPSNEKLWLFLQEQLSPMNNIQRTDTMMVMGSPKETTDLPIHKA
jgi:Lrp/AsnC family leucine-responsive transcriptional regulator